jgi:hypothetical protein
LRFHRKKMEEMQQKGKINGWSGSSKWLRGNSNVLSEKNVTQLLDST